VVRPFVISAFSRQKLKEKFTKVRLARNWRIFYHYLSMTIIFISVFGKLSESVIGNWLYLKVAASIK
jgi:hypothetical protein